MASSPFFGQHEIADISDETAHDVVEDEAVAEMGGQFFVDRFLFIGKAHHGVGKGGEDYFFHGITGKHFQ